MTLFEQSIAYGCIDRIHHAWFNDHDEEASPERISELFQALVVVAPYRCCHHVFGLWLAFRGAKDEGLWHLSRHRLRRLDDGLRMLKEIASRLPESARA